MRGSDIEGLDSVPASGEITEAQSRQYDSHFPRPVLYVALSNNLVKNRVALEKRGTAAYRKWNDE